MNIFVGWVQRLLKNGNRDSSSKKQRKVETLRRTESESRREYVCMREEVIMKMRGEG